LPMLGLGEEFLVRAAFNFALAETDPSDSSELLSKDAVSALTFELGVN